MSKLSSKLVLFAVVLFLSLAMVACGGDDDLVCPTGPGSCYNPALGEPKSDPISNLTDAAQNAAETAQEVGEIVGDAYEQCTDVTACAIDSLDELKRVCDATGGRMDPASNTCIAQ